MKAQESLGYNQQVVLLLSLSNHLEVKEEQDFDHLIPAAISCLGLEWLDRI